MDFAVPVDYREKSIKSKKIEKYLDLARELKITVKNGNKIIPNEGSTHETVPSYVE